MIHELPSRRSVLASVSAALGIWVAGCSDSGDGGLISRYFDVYPDAPYLNEEAEW